MNNRILVFVIIFIFLFAINVISINVHATTISIYQIPVKITNSQNVSTPNPFQEEIYLNINVLDSGYNINIIYNSSSNFANFEFVYANGQVVPSWIESNNSGTLLIWVKLPSIQAFGSIIIYLDVFPSNFNLLSSSGIYGIGENPLLSKNYAEYDDGSSVFDFYDNFDGSGLNSNKWVYGGSGSIIVDNGIIMKDAGTIYVITAFGFNPQNTIFDVMPVTNFPIGDNNFGVISMTNGNSGNSSGYFWFFGNEFYTYGIGSYSGSLSTTNVGAQINPGEIGSESWQSENLQDYMINYGYHNESFSSYPLPSQVYYGFGIRFYESNEYLNVSWARVRAYPPNDVMPYVSFGVVASVSYSENNLTTNNTKTYTFNSTSGNLQFNNQYFLFDIDPLFLIYFVIFIFVIFSIFMAIASVRRHR